MKKKIIALSVALVLVVAAAVSATLAYFTDTEEVNNHFTVGNVDISAIEHVQHIDGADDAHIKMDESLSLDSDGMLETDGYDYASILPGDTMTKKVTVTNDGANAAYVAIAVYQTNYVDFNRNIDNYYEAMFKEQGKDVDAEMQAIVDAMFIGDSWYDMDYTKEIYGQRYYLGNNGAVDQDGSDDYFGVEETKLIAIDFAKCSGVKKDTGIANTFCTPYADNMLDKTYYDAVGKQRIYVHYYYIPAGESVTLDLSIKAPEMLDGNSIQAFENMDLNVRATAIQVDGFDTAKEAFEALAEVYPYFA
ncbi:MAG: hypothetical protein IJN86_06915 [Clostridia bacterium]|nr:hypothetical protein [Clostridia bacterium]